MKAKQYKINPKWELILKSNKELLCVKNIDKIKKFKLNDSDIKDITFIITNKKFEYINNTVFKKLLKNKIIIEHLENLSNSFLENTSEYFNYFNIADINHLADKVIMIIGMGGIGTEILKHLIALNVSNFIIIDYDKVEISNLNRQYLYNETDIGKYKVDIIKKIYEQKNITAINKKITSSADITEILDNNSVDLIISAADKPFLDLRMVVLESSIKYHVPCIFASVGIESGQYGPLVDSKTYAFKYLKKLNDLKSHIIVNNTVSASFGPTNSIISAYAAKDIVFYLLNNKKMVSSLNNIIKIDFNNGAIYEKK